MSENTTKPSTVDDEVDLSFIFKGIKSFLIGILKGIINIFSFFFKNKFILLALIILGVVTGYFYEKYFDKIYTNEMLILPNYSSTNYVYGKIESIDKKLKSKDTVFLKNIFGGNYEQVKSVQIEPVIDIYNFVSRNESNKELFELLFEEEADIEFIENPINSRNFTYHRVLLNVKGEENHEMLSSTLMLYINDNEYLNNLNLLSLESLDFRLKKNKEIIKQIDTILNNSLNNKSLALDSGTLSFTDNEGLRSLIAKKEDLVKEQTYLKVEMVNQTQSAKVVDSNYKVLDTEDFLRKDKKKLFPLLFIILYTTFFLLKYIYEKGRG